MAATKWKISTYSNHDNRIRKAAIDAAKKRPKKDWDSDETYIKKLEREDANEYFETWRDSFEPKN